MTAVFSFGAHPIIRRLMSLSHALQGLQITAIGKDFDNFHSGCQAEKAQRRASKGVKLERSSATASITSLAKA